MHKISRTKATVLNTSSAGIAQFIQLTFQFVSRTIFIQTLGVQFVGLNGLFVNILSYLNFAELGIGSAITFSLYKPLANEDWNQVSGIMHMFKRVYEIIAVIVLIAGIIITPFIPNLIKNGGTTLGINIQIAFLLALANTVMSYLVTYKRTLLLADQRGYINAINTVGFNLAGQIIQIITLLIWHNFYVYLVIQACAMLLSNLRVSVVVDRQYKQLDMHTASNVDPAIISTLKHNISGMVSSKMGGIIVNGTDNILLSFYIGLIEVGSYSNYSMIVTGLMQIFNQLVSAVAASIGNLGATVRQKTKVKRVFYQYFMVSSSVSLFLSVGFAGFASSFVNIWLGSASVYSALPLFVISFNFFLQNLRQSLITYISSYGLYWFSRWKPVFESLINLLISWVLVKYTKLGVSGVLIGTIASNLLINIIWEAQIVMKHAIHENLFRFMRLYLTFIIVGMGIIYALVFMVRSYRQTSLFNGILISVSAEVISLIIILGIDWFVVPSNYSILKNRNKMKK